MPDSALTARGLGFRYPSGEWLFRGVDLDVPRGGVLAVIGRNGRGKTTLLKTLIGLLRPTEGRVLGRDTVGYVPQAVRTGVNFDAIEMVVMGRSRSISLFGSPDASDFRIARDCMETLGIGHLAQRPIRSLSGGERQLVLVAQALAGQCAVMVLDEPTAALDFHNQETMLQLLHGLARYRGITVLFTTHNPQHAALIAGTTLAMTPDGGVVCGPSEVVLEDGRLSELYGMDVRTVAFPVDGRIERSVLPLFRLNERPGSP